MNELKVFTLREANQLLPILIELIRKLQNKRDAVADVEVQIDSYELISHPRGTSSQELKGLLNRREQLIGEFYAIVDQIHEHGCFLKDPDSGLIDSYGIVNGRVVYFCWRLGENKISHWHETSQGYANRQPLIPD